MVIHGSPTILPIIPYIMCELSLLSVSDNKISFD